MTKLPHGRYIREFREEAVRLVNDEHLGIKEAAERLSLGPSTLAYWLKQTKLGRLKEVVQIPRPPTELEIELAKAKKTIAGLKMENEILKKAAAYFAGESLPGTHL